MLEKFMGCGVEWEKDGNINYMDRTVMNLTRLDAWIGRVVTSIDTNVGRVRQRQTLFSTLYGIYLRRAVASI